MNRNTQHKRQREYFNKEFGAIHKYQLAPWQKSYIDRIKKYMLDGNLKKKSLLDIASGTGYVAIEMAKLGLDVTAIDLSKKSVENLEEYKRQFNLTNLKVYKCKAENIPLKDGSMDYIVANAILEHIQDEKVAIKEWKRILKKNGRMFITVPLRFKYIWPFLWPINYIHDKRIGHLRRYDLEELRVKINLPIVRHFYTGSIFKVVGILLGLIFRNGKINELFEILDGKFQNIKYGANNISVIFEKE